MCEGGALFTVRHFVTSFEAIRPSLIMQKLSNMLYFPESIIFSISAVYIQYIAALLLYGKYNTPLAFIPHAKYYLAS